MAIRTVGDLRMALKDMDADAELTLHIDVLEHMVTVSIDPGMITSIELDESTNTVQMLLGEWQAQK